jgi:23S rRNA pseudouridine1911/1915/1917 synthase
MALMPRQALHAKSLGFVHPVTGAHIQQEVELPADFAAALEEWEKYAEESA